MKKIKNTMEQKEIRTHLEAARTLITKPESWTRCTYCDADGTKSYCASGAIVTAIGNCTAAVPVRAELQRAIKRHNVECRTIVHWNDHPARTHSEVMQAFGWAIDATSADGEPVAA